MTNNFVFSGLTCGIVSLIWSLICISLARRIEREECGLEGKFPAGLMGATWIAGTLAGTLLPAPLNLAMTVAIAGLLPAAWSDWRTSYLWDEIIVPTGFLVGAAMLIGGRGGEAMSGGVLVGGIYCMMWGYTFIVGREIGLGDVKMAAVMGAALGPLAGIIAFFVAAFIGIGLWLIRKMRGAGQNELEIPYGPALAGAMLLTCGFAPYIDSNYGFLLPAWFAVQP